VKYPIDLAFHLERFADIRLKELESGLTLEVGDIFPVTGDQIIDCKNLMASFNESVTQM
jgi:hypothetical protein